MADLESLDAIFKAYDVRGTVPDQLDADLSGRIGAAFARYVADADGAERAAGPRHAAQRRRRPRSPRACSARASTSSTSAWPRPISPYFASGRLRAPAAMFTASHNPARLQRHQAVPHGSRAGG